MRKKLTVGTTGDPLRATAGKASAPEADITTSSDSQATDITTEVTQGQLVWYNERKGYGFVTADNLKEDVFVHSRVLNDCSFHSLIQGQKILVNVDDSGRGLQVNSVRLLAE